MAKLIPSSLTGRLFLVSMLVILLFLPLAGLVLEQAYNNSLDRRLQEQLKIQAYSLMGLADEIEPGELWLPENLPDERFNQLGSGRYAQVTDSQGNSLWLSQSSLNIQLRDPIPNVLGELNIEDINPPGQFIFELLSLANDQLIETVRVTVIWEGPQESENIYTFVIAESLKPYLAEKQTFRDTLLFWLGGLGLFLLVVNAFALFWALRPLKKLADEIQQIEKGDIQILQTQYPTELNEVAKNLNVLINHEQQQRLRYRNTLQDLAHSLKTPLSVIQASLSNIENAQMKSLLAEHISRMNDIVSYQLQRAVSAGTSPIKQKVNVKASLEKIFEALDKVYRDNNITFQNQVAESCVFFGDENDLLEILGNLADNACKHGHSTVTVQASSNLQASQQTLQQAINIMIIDDGKGIPEALKKIVFQRGKRLDEDNEGQGIGLSVVSDIVASYKGCIDITTNDQQQNVIRVILPGVI
ncbi:MAG: two-component system sensor histidine kinase PhoQ [Enterobacterales bacterium]|jgi:two-component system sensor histidine kinase PhoQ